MDYVFEPDDPLAPNETDTLGVSPVAKDIAHAISRHHPVRGIVLGLEARWGSGKSTIINLIEHELRKESNPPLIIRFSPWLVDDRKALLGELLRSISSAIETAERKNKHRWDIAERFRRRQARAMLMLFARYAEALHKATNNSAVKTTITSSIPAAGMALTAFNAVASIALPILRRTKTLAKIKTDTESAILHLNKHIVIFVDDIDRLEPSEAREIFRVLKSVADFPLTTYVAAYDRTDVLGSSTHSETRHYIDKIVQVPISLPEADPSSLRALLIERLFTKVAGREGIIGRSLRSGPPGNTKETEESRFNEAVSPLVRTYLNTPRRIKIVCNSLRVLWPSISKEIDFTDYIIWLAIREFDPKMKSWVRAYTRTYERHGISRINSKHATELASRLETLLNRQDLNRFDQLSLLHTLLPTMRRYS